MSLSSHETCILLHTRKSIEKLTVSWQLTAFRTFESVMPNAARPFPCTLGEGGFNGDQLRYVFIDEKPCSDHAAHLLAANLQA